MKRKVLERLLIFGIPLLIMISMLIIVTVKGHINANDLNFDKLGGLGGFIGGLAGTYLTLIATFYVYKTFHYQKKELKSQKIELNNQKEFIRNQQFEVTFFNLINVHRELKKDLKIDGSFFAGAEIERERNGISVFEKINGEYSLFYNRIIKRITPIENLLSGNNGSFQSYINEYDSLSPEEKTPKKKNEFIYEIIFKKYQNHLSHYCRNVYHILKFIRENEAKDTTENAYTKFKQYANLFQSQLNVNEQIILFYNLIYFNDDTKEMYSTKALVEHYRFLENIGKENLIDILHEELYDFPIKG